MLVRLFAFILLLFYGLSPQAQKDIDKILLKASDIYDENPAESFEMCERAEREAKLKNDHAFDGDIAICKARYLILIASFGDATSELNKAILFFEEKKDPLNLATALSLKSLMLSKMGDHDAAHQMLLEVLELNRQMNDRNGVVTALLNLCLDYHQSGQADSMKLRLQELDGLQDDFEAEDYYYYHQNWGTYFSLTKDFQESIRQYELALDIADKEKLTDAKATGLMLLSKANRLAGNLTEADALAEQSYTFSEENNLIYETSEALIEWIEVKEELGQYESAFKIQKKWVRINDEIYNLEKIQKVKTMEGQLEIAEKEKEIAEGEIALQKSNLEGQKARTRNAWLIGIVLLVIVLLVYTAVIYVKTKKLNATIHEQKEVVELKSMHLEEALRSVQDSLEYSTLIQLALLPDEEEFTQCFQEHFVLYKPKDIVSGDFYWINQTEERIIVAVGDCTGHGVPGAMVSMVCHEALNKVVIEQRIDDPGVILTEVRKLVVSTFENRSQDLNDGMDIALCVIDPTFKTLQYAGAYNPLWCIRKKTDQIFESDEHRVILDYDQHQLIELKADKQPIGKYHAPDPFTTKELQLQKGDSLYLFSDGYADQFGGEKGKKLKATNLKQLLVNSQSMPMAEQGNFMNTRFEEWKGELEQVDDVCIIGLRI